jgi:hypothetical protein
MSADYMYHTRREAVRRRQQDRRLAREMKAGGVIAEYYSEIELSAEVEPVRVPVTSPDGVTTTP